MSYRQEWQRPITLQIDYDQLVWQALLHVESSFEGLETTAAAEDGQSVMLAKVSLERYEYNVRKLGNYILPEWKDSKYETALGEAGKDSFKRHESILQLLHRRNFFKRKDEMEVITGKLPKEVTDLLHGQLTGSNKAKTVSSS